MRKVGTTALVLLFLALATSLFAARTDTNVALAQSTNAIFSVQDGNWSDPATWHLGRPPQAGEHVVISPWTVVTYDVFSDEVLGQILVDGVLTISRTVDTRLKVSDHIVVGSISGGSLSHLVTGGFLDMGTTEDPIPAGVRSELIFVLPPSYQFVGGPFTHIDDIGLWAISGRWEVHGAPLNHTWAKLAADADAGSNVVIARHDLTDWTVGGSLVVTQTSIPYNPTSQCTLEDSCAYRWENEVRTITDLQLLPNGRTQITLDQPLNFDHQGTGRTRGEVGLLTRNVLIRSEILGVSDQTLDQSITQRRFAHTMFMGTTQGKIQYAEFKYMGHLETLARYPVHIHMTGTAGNGVEIRGNSIWRSGNRGYQVHNTQGVVVEDNVAFDTIMSPYYIERTGLPGETIPKDDATKSPHGNYVIHNLGVQATKGTDKGQGQQNDDAIFWLDQLDQVVLGNVGVAAGANGGTGGIPQGSETPRPEHSGMWIGEQAGSTGEIRTPVILKNELHSAASDGLGMWITKGPGLDFVDIKVWRNGQDGVKWGYYRNPHRLFQLQAIENRDDGFGSDTDNRSGTRYLVDAEFIGNFIGIKNGPDVVRPIYPDFPYTYIRPVFDGNTHAAMTLYSRDCSDEPLEETQPLSEKRSCHGNYVQVLEPVFRCGTTIDFSDGSEKHSVVNGGNKNTQWRIKDAQGLPPAFPNDFLLMRPDQIDPVNQTAFSQEFVSTDAWVAPELDNEALVVPIDSLPDSISPPVWGHSGSNSGGGVIDPVNYYTFEKAVDLPPEVSVNVTLDGKIATVNADATDDQGVARVEFYVDDVLVATETTAPYQTTVDLTDHPRKYAYIYAIAFDNHLLTYSNASQGALDTLPDDEEPVFQFLTRDQRAYSKVIELGPESYTAAASVPPGTAVLPLATLRDTSLEADLSSVDLGAPQDDSTFTMIDYPEHGSLCGAAPFMTYTPAPGYTGADSFTYQVTDLGGNTSIVTATINVFGDTLLYFSVKEPATLGTEGLVTSNEDIISFDGDTYSRFFDGSDVGIGALQIDAISIIGGNEILMSFSQDGTVPGIAEVVEDTDIVKFTATSLGETTSGSFELYFHGRGVGLGGNNDDINGIELLEDGRILVTTLSDFTADGLTGQGQDIIAFTPTQLGSATAGAWDMYLDGSDVSLDSNKERLTALSQHPSGDIYLSTESNFDVGTVSGWRDDAFVFQPQNLGDSTAGTYLPDLFFKGADHGLSGNHLMAIDLPTAGTSKVFVSANNLSLAEGGASTSYDVALLTQPASDVDIIVTPDGQASVSPNVLTFTAGDWNAPQTVTVTAIDDAVVEGDHNGGISHSSASADQQFVGVFIPGVALDISDNDSAPPVAQDQSIVLDQDSSIALVLTATDVDSPPEDLTFSVATPPASGALSGTAPDLTYTPNPGYSGPDSFTFVANDGSGDSAPATVSITVNPIFQLPTAQDQTVSATEDTPVGLTLTAVDPDTPQQELIFSVVTPPANGVLSGTAPDLTYTHNPDYNGPDSF
ncbi:MAG: Ig-like domain-containing protein, partial [Dehalococcoidia bacterium]